MIRITLEIIVEDKDVASAMMNLANLSYALQGARERSGSINTSIGQAAICSARITKAEEL